DHAPKAARKPVMSVQVPLIGPANIAGVPLPDAVVEQLRANVTIEPVLVDEHGAPIAIGRRFSALSPKIQRAVRQRDGHCRCGNNCDIRHGLEIHHLVPKSWGGTDDFSNLAAVFGAHHRPLIPHGPWALVGNPNQPDGLKMVRYERLTDEEAAQYGLPPPSRRPKS
ncbi:MAG: HNH endonuclease, partial [Acidimicrobiia bacterium]